MDVEFINVDTGKKLYRIDANVPGLKEEDK